MTFRIAENAYEHLENRLRSQIERKVLNLVQYQAKTQSVSGFRVGSRSGGGSNGQIYGSIVAQLSMYEGELEGYLEGIETLIEVLEPVLHDAVRSNITEQWINDTIRRALGKAVAQYGDASHPYHPDFQEKELAR